MPPSAPRRALVLLLPSLMWLPAVLPVPIERAAANQEQSPATESPVSGPACTQACCPRVPGDPGTPQALLSDACGRSFPCHCLQYGAEGDLVKNLGSS